MKFSAQDGICDAALNRFFPSHFTEKLYNSNGPELRRSLFSLKQLFQVNILYFFTGALQVIWECGPRSLGDHTSLVLCFNCVRTLMV